MKLTFEIQDTSENFLEEILLIQWGEREFSYVIYDDVMRCKALGTYQWKATDNYVSMGNDLKSLFISHPLFSKVFSKIILVYNTRSNVLVPAAFSNLDAACSMLEMVYGDLASCEIFFDNIEKLGAYNWYSVEKQLLEEMSRVFVCDRAIHQHSLLPEITWHHSDGFYCIFGLSSFTVMVHKTGQFQFIQQFDFNVPEDVVYHLLHIADAYSLNSSELQLIVSGYIDDHSPLFATLEKYFLHLEKDVLPEAFVYPLGIEKYPSHYFSHLFFIASCV